MMRAVLKQARRDKGMTQDDVADYLFISESYYKALESGKKTGSVELWDKLEDLFNVHQRILRNDE